MPNFSFPILLYWISLFCSKYFAQDCRSLGIFRIQWWCLLNCFRPEIPFLGKFGPKIQNCHFKLKFGTYAISKRIKFDGDAYFFCFRLFLQVLSKKIHLAFWCYLINLPAVCSQKLETSGFLVSIKSLNISKPEIIVSGTCPSFWFSWLSALACNSKVLAQTAICY